MSLSSPPWLFASSIAWLSGHTSAATAVALGPDDTLITGGLVILTNPPFGTKKGGGRPTRNVACLQNDDAQSPPGRIARYARAVDPAPNDQQIAVRFVPHVRSRSSFGVQA